MTHRVRIGLGRRLLESAAGASLIATHVILTKPLRDWRTTWGATAGEVDATVPGDSLVPDAKWSYTHAVTIDAPPERVWPWIAQLGQGRGGFYSYDRLENLVGCDVTNATEILPEFQKLRAGDKVLLHPKVPPLSVAILEPGSHLVLRSDISDTGDTSTWAFQLVRKTDGGTRLIERGRFTNGPGLTSHLAFGPTFVEPISFVMSRRMLLTIRTLSERTSRPTVT